MGLVAAFLAAGSASAELKIATVDLDKVFTAHPEDAGGGGGSEEGRGRHPGGDGKMVAEGRALQEEVAKLREAAKSPILTDEARLQKRNEAEEKLTELQEFQLRARRTQETKLKQLREQVLKSRQTIVDELMAAVAAFRAGERLRSGARPLGHDDECDSAGGVFESGLDVTDKLIEYLKAKARCGYGAAEVGGGRTVFTLTTGELAAKLGAALEGDAGAVVVHGVADLRRRGRGSCRSRQAALSAAVAASGPRR
jgi:Skp family chaperone for outer membrane proteins